MTLKTNTKRNLVVLFSIAVIAASLLMLQSNSEAIVVEPQFESTADGTVSRTVSPFLFELPNDSIDGVRYASIREGGLPEAALQRSKVVSLPLIIRPTTDQEVKVDFTTTFGEQTGTPKMPPGVHVTVEPRSVILTPGKDVQINLIVQVDRNAPDGLYFQNIVGKWGGPNDFSGTAISLKVGNGSPQFLMPGDVGQ
jgi:hypothetical protein